MTETLSHKAVETTIHPRLFTPNIEFTIFVFVFDFLSDITFFLSVILYLLSKLNSSFDAEVEIVIHILIVRW